MENIPAVLGLYTVYSDLRADMPGTLRRVADMGYQGVEFYGEFEWEAAAVRCALADAGIPVTGWHTEWRLLQPDTIDATAQYLREAGCPCAIVPCLGGRWRVAHGPEQESRALWEGYAARMNTIAARLSQDGIALGYHNHDHEFELRYDGETVFDLLNRLLDPAVILELDTGNAIEGGADPVVVLQSLRSRRVLLHCKPWSEQAGFNLTIGAEGDHNDWVAILAAGKGNCIAHVVECEATGGGFACAEECLKGLLRYR